MSETEPYSVFFGLGCFHFRPRSAGAPRMWAEAIKVELESVASIHNVEIDNLGRFSMTPDFDDWESRPLQPRREFSFDAELHPQSGWIAFTVRIPQRDQERLNLLGKRAIAPDGEFRVLTIYSINGPATLVQFCGSDGSTSSSEGVLIVRDFLEREFQRADVGLDFLVVGPSPFHANFRVDVGGAMGEHPAPAFKVSRKRNLGYDDFIFDCPGDALQDLVGRLTFEAQYFYFCVRGQGLNSCRLDYVSALTEDLIQLYRSKGY